MWLDHLGQRRPLDEHLVGGESAPVVRHRECGGGVPLWVEVDDEHLEPVLGQGRGHVHRRRRLADATLLVGHHHHPGLLRAGQDRPGPATLPDQELLLQGLRHGVESSYLTVSPT